MTEVSTHPVNPAGDSSPSNIDEEESQQRAGMVHDVVTRNLKALGAVSLEEYLASDCVGGTSSPGSSSSSSSPPSSYPSVEHPLHVHKTEDGEDEMPAGSRAAQDGTVNISAADEEPTEARSSPAVVSTSKYSFFEGLDEETAHPAVLENWETILVGTNGTITPYWLMIKDPNGTGSWGCALRIELSLEQWRVWSVDTTFDDPVDAQVACCKTYEDEILEYLREEATGIVPWAPCYDSTPIPESLCDIPIWTVQKFFETLPRSFPEDFGNKTADEIDAPSWLASMLQTPHGSELSANFIWTLSVEHALHGCLLRLSETASGKCRSYLVDSRFRTRAEAKAAVCLLAMSEDVDNFIQTRTTYRRHRWPSVNEISSLKSSSSPSSPSLSVKHVNKTKVNKVLTKAQPRKAAMSNSKYTFMEGSCEKFAHPTVLQNRRAIMDGTNGTVTPYWLAIKDPKGTGLWGSALRIGLSNEQWRVWSVDTTFDDPVDAQVACCKMYEDEILEYLREKAAGMLSSAPTSDSKPVPGVLSAAATWTVQQYFETLRKPFPEDVGNKTAIEINAPSWFNSMLQTSRGSKLAANFIWTESTKHGLHGCLLRLTAPGHCCRSYLVDSRFPKRAEAKAAVCLLAMSEGVGDFIRGLAKQVEDRLPPELRKRVTSLYLPTLTSECRKRRPEVQPVFDYLTEDECNGCTLTITLSHPTNPTSRTYSVPPEYRTRNDAKIAVVALAVSQGVLDFIGFDSRALSPTYTLIPSSSAPSGSNKRKSDTPDHSRASTPGITPDGRRKRRKYFVEGSSTQPVQPAKSRSPHRTNHRRQPSSHKGPIQPWSGPQPPNHYTNTYPTQPNIPYHTPMSNIPPTYAPPSHGYSTGSYPPNPNPYGSYYGAAPMPAQYNTLPSPPVNTQPYQHVPPTSIMQPYPNGMAFQTPPARNPVQTYPAVPPNFSYPPPSNATYSQPFQPYAPAPYPQQYGYPSSVSGAVQPAAAIPFVAKVTMHTQPKPVTDPSERKPTAKRTLTRAKPSKPTGGKVTVTVEPTPQSSVTELYDYCRASGLAVPQFRHEIVAENKGENSHKVWVTIGNKKLEVSATFSSLSQGQEKVARQALEQLRVNA